MSMGSFKYKVFLRANNKIVKNKKTNSRISDPPFKVNSRSFHFQNVDFFLRQNGNLA
ncbi:hypothetical protein LEP1GSC043_0560 [Leptospira weilii str. Ecochallenge]|uniref:Uncharacterized protein n=1 Tax=Leptospira weilii str. Ecochallenge TaxID=1049986 RepID=N1UKG0_9LEPT|nr:hypothetical protein LEP1GSC043_0560 [Leptospira weilii str. Ecochallenge]